MSSNKKIQFALFSAMPEELHFIQTAFSKCRYENINIASFKLTIYNYNNCKILIAHTGIGTVSTAAIIALIQAHCHPDYIFMSGTAGAIHSDLKLCDVVIADKAFEAEIQGVFSSVQGTPFESCLMHPLKNQACPSIYAASTELLTLVDMLPFTKNNIHRGTVVSSNSFPAPKELFDQIKLKNAYSIDMETSAFYQTAWLLNIPALAIRGISNILNQDGTDDKLPESDIQGSTSAACKTLLAIVDKLIQLKYSHHCTSVSPDITHLITSLNLTPHPEGGYYARRYKSTDTVKSTDTDRYQGAARATGSSIYYLLFGNDFSAWHCLKSDEIWHYYKGTQINIHMINHAGELHTALLGDPAICKGAAFQVPIPAGTWFAADIVDKSSYCLAGCTVTPGFEFEDFTLADSNMLACKFPQHHAIIHQLTRVALNH